MSSIVATADPTTGTVLLSFNQIEARDQFTRVVAPTWGVATTGETYIHSGGVTAEYFVNGTQGVHNMTSLAVSRNSTMQNPSVGPDMTSMISFTIPVVPLSANITVSHGVRAVTPTNQYMATATFMPSGAVELTLQKIVLGVTSTIAGPVTSVAPHTAGNAWTLAVSVCGSTIMGKVWRNSFGEPDWMLAVNDFDLTSGTNVVMRSILGSGLTNPLPIAITWDNLAVGVSQPIRIFRVTPDGTRTLVRGFPLETEPVTATSTSGAGTAWDGEAPFDVNVFYEMMSNCDDTVVATSNTINLSSGGDGWLRDPLDPTLNFPLTMEDFFDDCLDQNVVVFSGLGDPEYANASGIFDIINNPRPNTVSMLRKNHGSALYLTSFSLSDILDVEDILASGRILLLSLPTGFGWAQRTSGTDYITIGTVSQAYLGVDQGVTTRAWTLPFRTSPPPANIANGGQGGNGIGGGGATYDDLDASVIGTSYNVLTAAGFTYSQIAAGTGY